MHKSRIAVYLRISSEDRDIHLKGESNSISNQRKISLDYIHHDSELNKYELVEYCDDGYSGTNMERPGMEKMMEELKKGKIQCIIVKDLSRFSRDYIELGTYLNQIFPFIGVRLISIVDHYDSREHYGSTTPIDTAFKTLLYDLYSKDVSIKVKTAFENKCANGEYIFVPPFGYERSKEEKNTVIVNEEEAIIVRHIFSLALQGKGSMEIARLLYENQIPATTQFRKLMTKEDGRIKTWSHESVRNILNNRFYIGEMSYGKSVRDVGGKNVKQLSKEEWKTIPNHHEPLVTLETFEQVAFCGLKHSTKRKQKKNPLVGKLFCGGCGYSMNYKPIREKNKYRRFECRKHSLLKIADCCTYFNADILEELTLTMINKELLLRGNAIKQEENLVQFQKKRIVSIIKKQVELKQQQKQVRNESDMLYEEYAQGNIQVDEYRKQADDLKVQISSIDFRLETLQEEHDLMEEKLQKYATDMKHILRYSHVDELSEEIVEAFIKKIYVYRDKRVKIEWSVREEYRISEVSVT